MLLRRFFVAGMARKAKPSGVIPETPTRLIQAQPEIP